MDALVAYLQILGRLTDAAYLDTAAPELPPNPEQAPQVDAPAEQGQ
jgi:cytochrome c oxidase cbb3-type subunit 2